MKKLFLMVLMLITICSSCFAEWVSCESRWEFDANTIQWVNPNTITLEVMLRSRQPNAQGNRVMALAVLSPRSMNPSRFNCKAAYLVNAQGNIVANKQISYFEDFQLSNAICRYANIP